MSSNKTVYTLDLDVNSALQNYKKLIDTLKSSGGDPKAIKDLESAMAKLESQFGSLKTEAATGFTDSKGLTKFSKGVGDISVKMQQLGTRIKDVASNAENFPNSEFAQATKEIEKINAQFENLAKTANSDLIKSLGQMGFSKEQAANIAASVKSEEDLIAKIEEERQERMKASSAAAEGFKIVKQQIASDYMSKGGKTAIFGIDLISSTIKQEFDDSEGTLEAFETLAKEHLTNALSKGIDPQNAMQSIVSFAETFESELGEGFAEAIKKSLEDAEPTISGVVSNITTKASATKEGKAYAAASSSYQAIGGPGNSFSAGADATVSSYGASMEQLNALMERATQLTSILDSKQQALLNSMNGLKSGADGANSELEQQTGAVQQDANAMANAARESEQLAASFDQMTSRIKNLLSIGTIFNTIKNVIKQTFNDVQNLDKSFASIAMVTDQTVSGLWGSYDQYAALASKLGQSTNDVVQASALFYQQGLDTAEALSLTEDTMKLATLAGNDFKTATSEMTAALRGFKMEMDEGGHVTDVYSELAAHAAASVDDIALAMQRTASIANSAGMSFENTSAFLTQMIETTQESAENIGTSMKTIIARFTELKDNVAGTADSEFDDLDFNKVDKALKSVGVSLKNTSGQFRNLDEVFLELSSKWDSLDRNTQRYVATIAAGSRQQSRFIAMMDNYDRTVELMETAADAEGKADEQFAKYADTMEYKLNQLNTTWEQFRVDLMNTDLFNPIIEKVTEFVSLVNNADFHKFSGKAFAAEIAIMVVSIKNLIMNFLKMGKQLSAMGQTLGKTIAQKFSKSTQKELKNKKNQVNLQLKVDATNEAAKEAIKKVNQIQNNITKNKNIAVNVETKYDESSFQQLLNNFQEFAKGAKNADEAAKAAAESFDLSGDEAKEAAGDILEYVQAIQQVKQEESELPAATAEATQTQQQYNEALQEQGEQNQKDAILASKTAAIQQTLSTAFNAGALAIMGYASGTMTAGEALKSFGVNMLTVVGNLLLEAATTAMTEAIKRKEKAKTATATAASNATQTASNTVLAASEWAVVAPLLIIAAIVGAVALVAILIGNAAQKASEQSKAAKAAADANQQYANSLEKVKQAQENYDNAKDSLKSLKEDRENVEDIISEYTTLQKKVNKTSEDYDRMAELSEQIKNDYPDLVANTDAENGYVNLVVNAQERAVEALDDQIEAQEAIVSQKRSELTVANEIANTYEAMTKLQSIGLNLKANDSFSTDLLQGRLSIENKSYVDENGNVVKDSYAYSRDVENVIEKLGENNEEFLNLLDEEQDAAYSYILGNIDDLSSFGDAFDQDMIDQLNRFRDTVEEARQSLSNFSNYYDTAKEGIKTRYNNIAESEQNIRAAFAAENMDKKMSEVNFTDIFNSFIADNNISYGLEIFSSENMQGLTSAINDAYKVEELSSETQSALETKKSDIDKLYTLVAENAEGNLDDVDNLINRINDISDSEQKERLMNWARDKAFIGENAQENYESWAGGKKVYDQDIGKLFAQEYAASVLTEVLQQDSLYDATDSQEEIIKTVAAFQADLGNLSAEQALEQYDEIIQTLENAGYNSDDAVYQTIVDQIGVDRQDLDGLTNDMKELFGGKADDLKNSTQQLLKQTYKAASEAIGSEELAQKYTNDLLDTFQSSGIDESLWASLTPNWSNITDDESYEKAKEEWIKNAKDLGVTNAEEIWESMSDSAERWGALEIPLDVDKFLEDFDTMQESIESLGDSIETITKDMTDNGEISFSNFQTLKEDLEEIGESVYDYVNIDANGKITATEESLEKLLQAQLEAQKQKLQESKTELDIKISELTTQKNSLQAQLNALDAEEGMITATANINDQTAAVYKNWQGIVQAIYAAKGEEYEGSFNAVAKVDVAELSKEQKEELKKTYESTILSIDTQLDTYKNKQESINDELENWDKYESAYMRDHLTNMYEAKGITTDVASAQEDYNDALDAYNDQLETVAEKQETLNEKLEAYNELLYGSENRKSSLDYLYNYDEAINSFNDEISRAQDLLSDASSMDEATSALERYASATHNLIAEETAKQQVLQAGLANYADKIENGSYSYTNQETGEVTNINFGDYARKDERTGKYVIDQRLINESNFGDDWKDLLEEQVSNYNKYSEDLLKSEDNVRKAEKALRDERENALKNYVALEDKVKEVLKAEYQEQVDNLTDMYDSMKEADDDYITALQEAIEKQRELREQENAWEDLAEKEKKLSLMQRDTSGANQVETMELEEEIQEDRESLLDDAIDNIIDGLSDLYESQSELRDAELELKEALLENDAYWAGLSEATAQGFVDLDDATEWYLQHSLELTDMTAAGAESDILGFQDTYSSATEYMAMQLMDNTSETGDFINDAINVTGEEAMEIVQTTSETFTTEAQRAFNETQKTFETDMEKAEQDIKDAKDALQEAVNKLGELAAAANAAAEAYAAAKRAQDELNGINPDDSGENPSTPPTTTASSGTKALFDWVDLKNKMNGMSYEINNNGSIDSGTFSFGANSSFTHAQLAGYIDKLYKGNELNELRQIAGVMSLSTTKNNGSTALTVQELYDKIKQRMILSDNSLSSVFKYAEGGLVDYTGPAWVDGTFNRPEAFLSADDTERIGNAAKILADIPWIDRDTDNSSVVTNNGGDVSVEINLNIDHISSDTDLDEMIERVKEEIVEVARPTGTNVILQQQL